jgi:hypothetical protein
MLLQAFEPECAECRATREYGAAAEQRRVCPSDLNASNTMQAIIVLHCVCPAVLEG